MSPPKVNLAGKEPLQNVTVSNENLPEKSDGLEFPAVITVESNRRIQVDRQEQRQRARRLMCGIAMLIIVTVAAFGTMALVHRLRRYNRKHWSCKYGKNQLPEHVEVDHHNRLIHVHHDHDENSKTPAIEILHEYNRKMVAYKDVEKKICYIDRLDETFETGYEKWESYEKSNREDQKTLKVISDKKIEAVVIKHVLDEHIWLHCQDSVSKWVMEIEEKEVTSEMEIIRV